MMMKTSKTFLLIYLSLLVQVSCVDPYAPPALTQNHHFLVVDGMLTYGGNPTSIKLSRTAMVSDTSYIMPEQGAQVLVEGEDNSSFELVGNEKGEYKTDQLNLNEEGKYRLRIRTSEGKEYLSDYVEVKETPAIDSLNWKQINEGVEIYVTTHDPANTSRYYRWEYEETWEYHSTYDSQIEYIDGKIVERPLSNQIYKCWDTEKSTTFQLGTSVNLEQDIIYQKPFALIPENSRKISKTYSILVKQYAIEEEAFYYYQLMKKNTEQRGSFFDPQPAEIRGNIYCVAEPEEPVIGYFSLGNYKEDRIFIDNYQLQNWWWPSLCPEVVKFRPSPDMLHYYLDSLKLVPIRVQIVGGSHVPPNPPKADSLIHASVPECVDCNFWTGTTKKPDFWPY